ncbi:PREDICTED: tctex1 domain-containing protein 1-A-like [Branchiostoma belcheri]|uniref:Tctex1 domain-containing protein 1-A-like n=1 Tax=Branchiostoma belcheri TaxID=7741 RepID=A0A6P5A2X9_BRABE|nr:PREDICTED: tctex1 domain-containing protein 1-A-like [Branchiostoma belcheri]
MAKVVKSTTTRPRMGTLTRALSTLSAGSSLPLRRARLESSTTSAASEASDDLEFREKVPPTYQLEPAKKFSQTQVKTVIQSVLENKLGEVRYEDTPGGTMAKSLADAITKEVKKIGFDRYKIVCTVSFGPLKNSSVKYVSRCVWNPQFDNFAEYTYRNKSLYCVGTVYGVYME